MDTNKKDQRNRQPAGIKNMPSAGEERKDTPKRPRIPVPDSPVNPVKPDENPNPKKPDPGINEPEKNDPTRIDIPPEIINEN